MTIAVFTQAPPLGKTASVHGAANLPEAFLAVSRGDDDFDQNGLFCANIFNALTIALMAICAL
jgi:hypothetical protein